jgi:hypothetical protein
MCTQYISILNLKPVVMIRRMIRRPAAVKCIVWTHARWVLAARRSALCCSYPKYKSCSRGRLRALGFRVIVQRSVARTVECYVSLSTMHWTRSRDNIAMCGKREGKRWLTLVS